MKKTTARYTLILHDARKKLGLNKSEYTIADSIYHLSSNPNSISPGWCYASKITISEFADITREHVHRIINQLISKGIVEKDFETGYLRTTEKWYKNVIETK